MGSLVVAFKLLTAAPGIYFPDQGLSPGAAGIESQPRDHQGSPLSILKRGRRAFKQDMNFFWVIEAHVLKL